MTSDDPSARSGSLPATLPDDSCPLTAEQFAEQAAIVAEQESCGLHDLPAGGPAGDLDAEYGLDTERGPGAERGVARGIGAGRSGSSSDPRRGRRDDVALFEVHPPFPPPGMPAGPGFACGGALDTLPPGPGLLAAVDDACAVGLGGLSDDALAGVILAARRCESRAAARLLAAVDELGRRRTAPDQRAEPAPATPPATTQAATAGPPEPSTPPTATDTPSGPAPGAQPTTSTADGQPIPSEQAAAAQQAEADGTGHRDTNSQTPVDGPTPDSPAPVDPHLPASGQAPASGPPPPPADTQRLAAWLARLKTGPIQAGDCTHARAVPGYRIPDSLDHIVKIRQQTCSNPICARPATQSDDDHTRAHDKGGITCECGLGPT